MKRNTNLKLTKEDIEYLKLLRNKTDLQMKAIARSAEQKYKQNKN